MPSLACRPRRPQRRARAPPPLAGAERTALVTGRVIDSRIRTAPAVPSWVLKLVIAVTGTIYVLFLLAHVFGNLKVLTGASTSTSTPTGCTPSSNRSCRGTASVDPADRPERLPRRHRFRPQDPRPRNPQQDPPQAPAAEDLRPAERVRPQ